MADIRDNAAGLAEILRILDGIEFENIPESAAGQENLAHPEELLRQAATRLLAIVVCRRLEPDDVRMVVLVIDDAAKSVFFGNPLGISVSVHFVSLLITPIIQHYTYNVKGELSNYPAQSHQY
jgi:hypothetical protein